MDSGRILAAARPHLSEGQGRLTAAVPRGRLYPPKQLLHRTCAVRAAEVHQHAARACHDVAGPCQCRAATAAPLCPWI